MKKMIFVLTALLLAAPAMAGLTISCSQDADVNEVAINYVATADVNIPRGLGLEVTIDSGVTVTGVEAGTEDPNYWVYPGSIIIDTNDPPSVADDGTPLASGQGTSTVILEMGSLHWPTAANSVNAPPQSGRLLVLKLSGTDCNVSIAGNGTRGNVVDYAAAELVEGEDLTYTGCHLTGDCFPSAHPDYAEWVSVGKPSWWCYPRHCHGDADGLQETIGRGQFWVGFNDLGELIANWTDKQGFPAAYQADFTHSAETIGRGSFRVGFRDLDVLIANWTDKLGSDPNCLTDY